MSVVLALETTTDICSVAVGTRSSVVEETQRASRKHNTLILRMIDTVLRSSEYERQDIDCIAFSAGPGSFTGVRLSASVAQGVAFALDTVVCPVPTSWVMARSVIKRDPSLAEFATIRVSRRNLAYYARFQANDGIAHCIEEDRLVDMDSQDVPRESIHERDCSFSAGDVLVLALEHKQMWTGVENALPIYVEGDTPWRPRH